MLYIVGYLVDRLVVCAHFEIFLFWLITLSVGLLAGSFAYWLAL